MDWNEFALYLKWAMRQFPQTKTAEDLLSLAFRKGLVPAMRDEIVPKIELPDRDEEMCEDEDEDFIFNPGFQDDSDDEDFFCD